jgi:hypothetical protein
MKKTYLVLLVFVSLFVQTNSFAQFNLPKKKGTANKTTTDKVAPSSSNVETAPVQVVAAPTINNNTVDPNIKPTKVVDTTVVGGFNSNNKKSLRNNYAFFSETKKRKGVQERLPLPYENLREEDALFSEFMMIMEIKDSLQFY